MKNKFKVVKDSPIYHGQKVQVWLEFTNVPLIGKFYKGIHSAPTKGNEHLYTVTHSFSDDKVPTTVTQFTMINVMGVIVFDEPLQAIERGKQELKVLQWKLTEEMTNEQ